MQHHNDDIFKIKSKLREELITLDEKCYNIINSDPKTKTFDHFFYKAVIELLTQHRQEIQNSVKEAREGNFIIHKQILQNFNSQMEPIYLGKDNHTIEKDLLYQIHNIILEINHIEQLSNQIIPQVIKVRQLLNDNEDSSKNKLIIIKGLIDKAIETSKIPTSK